MSADKAPRIIDRSVNLPQPGLGRIAEIVGHLWHAGRARAAALGFEKGIDRDFERGNICPICANPNRANPSPTAGFPTSLTGALGLVLHLILIQRKESVELK